MSPIVEMKILNQQISAKDGQGFVKLEAQESEDMYDLYNLIAAGDHVKSTTLRNVVTESSTGSTRKSKMKLNLTIAVESAAFDMEKCSLRLNGRNMEENDHIKLGQYHSVELEVGRAFTVTKNCWDSRYIELLRESCDPSQRAEIAAVVMQDGLCNVCLLTKHLTIVRSRIEVPVPRKKQGDKIREKGKLQFFQLIFDAIRQHVNFDVVKSVLLGSPGFLREEFLLYWEKTALSANDSAVLRHKSKFVLCPTSSGYKHAILEIMANEELRGVLADVHAAAEVCALQGFHEMMSRDIDRCCYGFDSVQYADSQIAVDTLLVTDTLFRASDICIRKRYVDLIDSVRSNGGTVHIFSGKHSSGIQLDQYTGVAAVLRFPLSEDLADIDKATESVAARKYAMGSSDCEGKVEVFCPPTTEDLLDML